MRRRKLFFIVPAALAGMILFVFLGGEVVKLLWNWLTPAVFGWRAITFWQALGLLVLCRILFGGLWGHGGPRDGIRRRMRERWDGLTPEERERFRDRMKRKCGWEPAMPEAAPPPSPQS